MYYVEFLFDAVSDTDVEKGCPFDVILLKTIIVEF